MAAQVFEVPGQRGQIVPANAEVRHRETVQEEYGCASWPQRREQSQSDVAGDPGPNEFLDDVKILLELVLSCLRVVRRRIECGTMIFARPKVG
jgi:hypothetical protein